MRNKAAMGVLLAARHKLPMVYAERCFVISGGPDFLRPSFCRAVSGIGRLRRKGKKPVALPIVGANQLQGCHNHRNSEGIKEAFPQGRQFARDPLQQCVKLLPAPVQVARCQYPIAAEEARRTTCLCDAGASIGRRQACDRNAGGGVVKFLGSWRARQQRVWN